MIDIARLSRQYDVRRLGDADADVILELYEENTQYFPHADAEATREQVLSDLSVTPPGIGPEDKYFIGFYRKDALIAVMDLVDGYPEPGTAFIGLFMMRKALQGRNIGSAVIRETEDYLASLGMSAVRLAIDQGNPQSAHFWKKNGFAVIREVERNGKTVLLAERALKRLNRAYMPESY